MSVHIQVAEATYKQQQHKVLHPGNDNDATSYANKAREKINNRNKLKIIILHIVFLIYYYYHARAWMRKKERKMETGRLID